MVDSETKGARRAASLQFLVNLKLKTQNFSPDPPIRLEAPVIHAGEEKRTSGFSRLHSHG
jgi:hypothetical protein